MNAFQAKTVRILGVLSLLPAQLLGAVVEKDPVSLNPLESWQCRANQESGRRFAQESLAGATCGRLLAAEREIVAPLLRAADFPPANFTQACWLNGYRAEVTHAVVTLKEACVQEVGMNFKAGSELGYQTCRLFPVDAMTPDYDIERFVLTPANPNEGNEILQVVHPVRDEAWGRQLLREQNTGFLFGCLLGERDIALNTPSPFLREGTQVDWPAAARSVGMAFGAAYCPMTQANAMPIVSTLTGRTEGEAFAAARMGFEDGFLASCNEPL